MFRLVGSLVDLESSFFDTWHRKRWPHWRVCSYTRGTPTPSWYEAWSVDSVYTITIANEPLGAETRDWSGTGSFPVEIQREENESEKQKDATE